MGDNGYEFREETAVHRHDRDPLEALPRGRTSRRRDDEAAHTSLAAQAASAGRTDALGHASILRLQRAAGNAGTAAMLENETDGSPVHDVIGRGGGAPLDADLRGSMEQSFGTDFSDVRVHTGGSAAASAQAVDAHAYTVGSEIVLGDTVGSGAASYERTLAHELTHVVQQRSGPVDGTPTAGGVSLSSPSDRFEQAAESTADQVMTGGPAGEVGAGSPAVQRQEDEEEVQMLRVQRQEDEEEEVQTLSLQRQGEDEEEEVQTLSLQRQGEDEEEEVQMLRVQRHAGAADTDPGRGQPA